MDIQKLRLDAVFRECDIHITRLKECHSRLVSANIFPLDFDKFEALSADDIMMIDQFVYRFTKLQSAMGGKLFPLAVSELTDNDSPLPIIDILNILEKFNLLSSTEEWQEFRTLRNKLAHEYPEDETQKIDALNSLFLNWQKLAETVESLKGGLKYEA